MKTNEIMNDGKIENRKIGMELDSGIKFFIAVILSVLPFLLHNQNSFIIISIYLIIATIVLGIQVKTIVTSIAAYSIIVVLPYLFGFLISMMAFWISGNEIFSYHNQINAMALRIFQLFLLWYIGSLYFNSTPMESIIGLFDKLLYPLKLIGVPISEYLKVIMCVVRELKLLGPEVKTSFSESMRSMRKDKKSVFRINIKGVSNILVSFIVNSFKRLDSIEEYLKQVESEDLYNYRFKFTKEEIMMIMSIILLVYTIIMLENGYW